jgi:uncharacterized protein (TIRG00374 family)
MSTWVKNTVQYLLFLGIGLALLYFSFQKVNTDDLWEKISSVSISGLIGIIAIGFLAMVFRGLRWVQMMKSMGYQVTGTRAISAVALSYLVNLVTPRVGEIIRCTALKRTNQVPIDKSLGTVVLERMVDLLMFLFVVISTLIISRAELSNFLSQNGVELPQITAISISLYILGFSFLTFIIIKTKKYWCQWKPIQKLKGLSAGVVQGIKSLRTVDNKPLFWLYSIGIWSCYVATIAVGFTLLSGFENIGFEQAFFVSVAAGLGFIIPVPGGIGTYHYLVTSALIILGVSETNGATFATLIHGSQSLMFVITGALGFVFLYFAGRK